MTGEITLRGLVLPVGGIKEKVLAAQRAGIDKVILPKKNEKDMEEIEKEVIGNLQVEYIDRMEPLLEMILEEDSVQDPAKFVNDPEPPTHSATSEDTTGDYKEDTVVMD